MKRRIATFTALLLAATLISCAPATEPDSRNQEPDHGIMHKDQASPEQVEIDEWNSVVAAEAKDTATQAATAYARPDLSETDWFKGAGTASLREGQEHLKENRVKIPG